MGGNKKEASERMRILLGWSILLQGITAGNPPPYIFFSVTFRFYLITALTTSEADGRK